MVVSTVQILNLVHTLLKSSLTPAIKGREMVYLGVLSCLYFLFLDLAAFWIKYVVWVNVGQWDHLPVFFTLLYILSCCYGSGPVK